MRIQKLLCFVLSMAIASVAQAEDLVCVYELALRNDPTLEAAKETQKAIREALPQAQAQFMPNVNASASLLKNHTTSRLNPNSSTRQSYTSNEYTVTLTQPVYHFEHWATLAQAGDTIRAAKMSYFAAEQDLIMRTAERYFAVLLAEDTLHFAKARRNSFGRFLDQSEQRYRVGLIAVTDVQIARARHDNAYSQEIAAATELANQKEKLSEITGVRLDELAKLRNNIKLVPPVPMDMEQWVNKSITQNLELQASRYQAGAAKADIQVKRAGHLPTVDLMGQYDHNAINTPFATKGATRSLGVKVNLPVFSGGSVSSKTRQSVHNFLKADSEYEVLHRTVESLARQSYRNINSEIDQVNALKQAVISNQGALRATEDSFNVGTRTIVDVLNSQSDLIKAQQELSTARYNYILDSLRLKKAAGILCPTDLQHINAWLKN